MEISIILDNKVVYEKEFGNYIKKLKYKTPEKDLMRSMEEKFMNLASKDSVVGNIYKVATGTAIATACSTTVTYAAMADISERIRVITNPIIELLAGLGYPITYGMLITGAIMVIMGKKSKGLEIIKWACIGYIGLQFVPFMLGFLETIGQELRNSL